MTTRQRNVGPCSVGGCEQPSRKRGWCASHYAQSRRTGEPPKPFLYKWGQPEPRPFIPKPGRVRPECSVDGCASPNDAHGYCTKHVTRYRRHGDPNAAQWVWHESDQPCVVCGREDKTIKSRFLCSKGCERLYYAYDGAVPTERECVQCGAVTKLADRTIRGNRRRSDGGLCDQCQRNGWRTHCLTVDELAERDGLLCSICDDLVDLNLRRRDSLMCPSIDHVIPRSKGGSNDPANLALAHLLCNIRKSDRVAA